jgi:DNA-binding GntR family transcriptional regulator
MQVTHQPAPVRMQAVEAIRREIISGRMPPGARLIERELTEALGVSRNTLREAFRQLEAEGLLEIRPHRGPTVATLAPQAAMDLYEVREAIECMAVSLFTLRAPEEELVRLERAFDRYAEAVEHGDTAAIVSTKDAFYDLLYAGTGNQELHAQARTMYGRLAGLRLQSLSRPGRPGESLFEMRQVLQTMHARDAERAAELWREHIRHAANAALTSMRSTRETHSAG